MLRRGSTTVDVAVEEIRALLAAREQRCWLRLEDAVSELAAVHGAGPEEIVDRVRWTMAVERRSGDRARR